MELKCNKLIAFKIMIDRIIIGGKLGTAIKYRKSYKETAIDHVPSNQGSWLSVKFTDSIAQSRVQVRSGAWSN